MSASRRKKVAWLADLMGMPFREVLGFLRDTHRDGLALYDAEIRRDELRKIYSDPASRLFGKTVAEVEQALNLAATSNTVEAYKKGFKDALETIKRVAQQSIDSV